MLQDLDAGRLENEFRNITADAEDVLLCFHEGQVLLRRDEDDALTLPTLSALGMPEKAPRFMRFLKK